MPTGVYDRSKMKRRGDKPQAASDAKQPGKRKPVNNHKPTPPAPKVDPQLALRMGRKQPTKRGILINENTHAIVVLPRELCIWLTVTAGVRGVEAQQLLEEAVRDYIRASGRGEGHF
jgi:hypothetical protein